ncbi:MAG: hypothetical protein MJ239_07445 [Bacilli bacterium]|nr:hypothetical protein [Bacilli bacterium]
MRSSLSEKEILKLCSIQGDIFECSLEKKVDEVDFIGNYMKSRFAKSMDQGDYFLNFEDKISVTEQIGAVSKKTKKLSYDAKFLHFAGYFYRYYCYRYNKPSILVWKEIPISYLKESYPVLHSLDIEKACETVYEVFLRFAVGK